MSRKKKTDEVQGDSHLTIVEAVENLSNLADMDQGDRLGVIEDHLIVHDQDESEEETPLEAIQWLEEKSQYQTEEVVSETFKAVLHYVKDFHKKEFTRFYDQKNQEGLKKIMLLVGKASDNLQNFTHLFSDSRMSGIEDTKEYKQLSKFYNERIAIEDQEKVSLIDLSRKARNLDLSKHPIQEEDENIKLARQFIVDIEKIKNDDSYELLYLQRDDGSRFYSSAFYRNLKLACNFGEYPNKNMERDPLEGLKIWLDASLQESATKTLKLLNAHLKVFFQESGKYREMEMVSATLKAIMALMMAANPKNKIENVPIKSCAEYYYDFQAYLRETLTSFEYQKLQSFPPPSSNIFLHNLIDVVHLMSWASFCKQADYKNFKRAIDDIIEEGRVSVSKKHKNRSEMNFWERIEDDYTHISRYILSYPIGPLFKTLHNMQEGLVDEFDNLFMHNYNLEWAKLNIGNKKISMLRMPSPTRQELINKVHISGEFIGLMDAYSSSKKVKKHLLINLQDRTQWKENSRALALEKLPKQGELYRCLDVVTLCRDSDFYKQVDAYSGIDSIQNFFKQIILQLHSPETGFYFPKWIEEKLFSGFVEKLIQQVHRFFFDSKSKLNQLERQNFIEILYHFITLKLIEICEVDSFSFTCKDGLDSASAMMCGFYAFLKRLCGEKLSEEDRQKMQILLFGFPMIVRQRAVKVEMFQRFLNCQKQIEKGLKKHANRSATSSLNQYFGFLYETPFKEIDFLKLSLDQVQKPEKK